MAEMFEERKRKPEKHDCYRCKYCDYTWCTSTPPTTCPKCGKPY